MVSFTTVEKTSFQSLLKTLDCQYNAPGQKFFSEVAVPDMCNKLRNKVQVLVSEGHHFTLTTHSIYRTPYKNGKLSLYVPPNKLISGEPNGRRLGLSVKKVSAPLNRMSGNSSPEINQLELIL